MRRWIPLLALVVLIGGVWYFTSDREDDVRTDGRTTTTERVAPKTTTTIKTVSIKDVVGTPCEDGSAPKLYGTELYGGAQRLVCHASTWKARQEIGEGCDPVNGNVVNEAGVELLCAEYNQVIENGPATTFGDGHYTVGTGVGEVAPGTYETGPVSDCYWERVDGTGETIDNNFVTGAPRVEVTVRSGDAGLNVEDCGTWTKVS